MSELRFISKLGSGAFATVLLAQDAQGNNYAVKATDKTSKNSSKSVKSLKKELSILKMMPEHPSIIKVSRSVESEKYYYLVMEKCHMDLYDYLSEYHTNGMSLEEAAPLFIKIAQGIKHCHKHNVFHRDLKPENILLVHPVTNPQDAEIRVADFGLATTQNISSEYGCGSIRYMSPECCLENNPKRVAYQPEKADVWALAIVLINLLTGRNPWEKPVLTDVNYLGYYKSFAAKKTGFFSKAFGFGSDLDRLLRSCFHQNPTLRPTVAELLQDFEAIATRKPEAIASRKQTKTQFIRKALDLVKRREEHAIPV